METSLHRTLKDRYACGQNQCEVSIAGFRIDAIDESGRLIEIQSGPLGPLSAKMRQLLPAYRLRIVKPVVLRRRLVRKSPCDGRVLSTRRSPKRGTLTDVFDDLIGIVRVFPHANLEIEVLGVAIDEVRIVCRRHPGFTVSDRALSTIHEATTLSRADDLFRLLPPDCTGSGSFTTLDLARRLDRPVWFAQRVAYCLRKTGAARVVGKSANRLIYTREAWDD